MYHPPGSKHHPYHQQKHPHYHQTDHQSDSGARHCDPGETRTNNCVSLHLQVGCTNVKVWRCKKVTSLVTWDMKV